MDPPSPTAANVPRAPIAAVKPGEASTTLALADGTTVVVAQYLGVDGLGATWSDCQTLHLGDGQHQLAHSGVTAIADAVMQYIESHLFLITCIIAQSRDPLEALPIPPGSRLTGFSERPKMALRRPLGHE